MTGSTLLWLSLMILLAAAINLSLVSTLEFTKYRDKSLNDSLVWRVKGRRLDASDSLRNSGIDHTPLSDTDWWKRTLSWTSMLPIDSGSIVVLSLPCYFSKPSNEIGIQLEHSSIFAHVHYELETYYKHYMYLADPGDYGMTVWRMDHPPISSVTDSTNDKFHDWIRKVVRINAKSTLDQHKPDFDDQLGGYHSILLLFILIVAAVNYLLRCYTKHIHHKVASICSEFDIVPSAYMYIDLGRGINIKILINTKITLFLIETRTLRTVSISNCGPKTETAPGCSINKWRFIFLGLCSFLINMFGLLLMDFLQYYLPVHDVHILYIIFITMLQIIVHMLFTREFTPKTIILSFVLFVFMTTAICNRILMDFQFLQCLIIVMVIYSINAFLLNVGVLQYLAVRALMTIHSIIMETIMIAHDIVDHNFKQTHKVAIAKAVEDLLQQLFTWLSQYILGNQYHCSFKSLLKRMEEQEFWDIVLVIAGNVEQNPGPPWMSAKQLAKISNEVLVIDNLVEIFDQVSTLAPKWHHLCLFLHLPPQLLSEIEKNHPGDSQGSLRDGLTHWLERNYNTEGHGLPSWRKLAEAVDNPAGGSNHKLALDIAEKHKSTPAQSQRRDTDCDHSESKRAEQMSSAFNKLYRAIMRQLRVDVSEVKDVLRYCSNPRSLSKRCVSPSVYKNAASTKDLLDRLYPKYINPENTFVLREIVDNCGSCQCKKLLKEYTSEFHD